MITVDHLNKSYPSSGRNSAPVRVLRDVNLEVETGSLHGIVGSARAGKSTLAKCVALRDRPDTGAVRLDGLDAAGLEGRRLRELRRQVGFVPKQPELQRDRTAAGNVAAPLERRGFDGPARRERVGSLLDLVGLTRRAALPPAELSAGQRQRVALATSLAANPSVLVADDPTAGVDTAETSAVVAVLDRIRAELGTTVLLTTPDAGVARRACDGISLLDDGTVVESGQVLGLLGDVAGPTARLLLPAVETDRKQEARFDRTVDVVLIGFAAVGALLPEAASRFDAEFATIGGGVTRLGDTPVARFRVGVRGAQADAALTWISERGAQVAHTVHGPQAVAAA